MKTLRMIGVALVAVVLSMGFTACSDDDDEGNSSLSGTTWKVTSCNDGGEDDPLFENGTLLIFNKDNTITLDPNMIWGEEYVELYEPGAYIYWSMKDDVLTIDFRHDDCIEGPFVIDGKKATYTYHWYDFAHEWTNTEYYTMTLEKQ